MDGTVGGQELHSRAQGPVGLGPRSQGVAEGDDWLLALGEQRYAAHDRHRGHGPREVLLALDRVVEELQEEDDADAHQEPGRQSHEQRQDPARRTELQIYPFGWEPGPSP